MFSRPNKPQGRPEGRPSSSLPAMLDHGAGAQRKPGPPKIASVIADDIIIDGEVTGDGELHLDGVIRGDVRVARLGIGETGQVEGAVSRAAA